MPLPKPENLDPNAVALTRAIAKIESGGSYQSKGASGESGAYQFMPQTWKERAAKYLGNPNAPLTPENQNFVQYSWVKEQKDQGLTPDQILAKHNSGGVTYANKVGVNQFGVKYNVPEYVQKGLSEYQREAQKLGGSFGETPQIPVSEPKKSKLGFGVNAVLSTGRLLGDIGKAILNPIDTLSGISNLAAGTLEHGIKKGANALGIRTNDVRTPEMDMASNAASFYSQRYGIGDAMRGDLKTAKQKLLNTAYEDPAGVAADVSTLLGGAGALTKGLGTLSRTSTLSEVGQTFARASELTNPLTPVAKGFGAVSNRLEKSASRDYTDVLAPTTKQNKHLTEGVVDGYQKKLPNGDEIRIPGLVERNVITTSREALAERIASELDRTGEVMKAVEGNIPAKTPIAAKPILDQIENAKAQFIIEEAGKKVVADPAAVQALDDFANTIREMTNENVISRESLTRLKQIWQGKVQKSGKYYGKTLEEGSKVDMLDEAERAIRRELDRQFPDLAIVNAEYNFWKNAEKIIKETIERKTGQSGIVGKGIAAGIGGIAGASTGVFGAIGMATVVKAAFDVIRSPMWKSVSAVTKAKLARAIAAGKFQEALKILRSIGVPTTRIEQATKPRPTPTLGTPTNRLA